MAEGGEAVVQEGQPPSETRVEMGDQSGTSSGLTAPGIQGEAGGGGGCRFECGQNWAWWEG